MTTEDATMSRDWAYLTWREKTWGERAQTAAAWTVVTIIGLAMFVGGLMVLGMMVDGRHKSEHDRCLKRATNGYEIRECR